MMLASFSPPPLILLPSRERGYSVGCVVLLSPRPVDSRLRGNDGEDTRGMTVKIRGNDGEVHME